MKIVFLCGSLEPGRDGVGDYTRRLAGELISLGNMVGIIALNDYHQLDLFNGHQSNDKFIIPILRLPSMWPAKLRYMRAKIWIEKFEADLLSLQFVPFSFHPKGLPFKFIKLLKKIGQGRRWHIMFHELWVGMNVEASIKYVCWGWLQKQIIKFLIFNLKPTVIHTQTKIYQLQLSSLGYKAKFLPLFSNIPSNNLIISSSGGDINFLKSSKEISFVIFGSILPGAPLKVFANEVANYNKENSEKISLKIIGRSGEGQKHWANAFELAGVEVKLMGEQSPERISELLASSSFGISTTPIALAEKSGSIMAMREHGLPVICVSMPWAPREFYKLEPSPGILEYREGNLESCLSSKENFYGSNSVSKTSKIFINSILASD